MDATASPAAAPAPDPVDAALVARFNTLMQGFLQANAITGWTPSTDASMSLTLTDGTVVDFNAFTVPQAHGARLLISAQLLPMPDDPQGCWALCTWLLEQNAWLAEGCRLTTDGEIGYALCQRRLVLDGLGPKELDAAVTELLDEVGRLRDLDPMGLFADREDVEA